MALSALPVPAPAPGRCPSPPALSYADRSPQREFLVGSTVTYFCRHGYTLIPEVSPTITCLKNFTWSAIPTLCQSKCPGFFAPPTKQTFNGGEIPSFSKHPPAVQCHKAQCYIAVFRLSAIIILPFKGWHG